MLHSLKPIKLRNVVALAIEALVISNDEGQSIRVTASFGIAQSHHGLRPQQVLSQADKALYAAKASGRNQIKCYLEINPGETQI